MNIVLGDVDVRARREMSDDEVVILDSGNDDPELITIVDSGEEKESEEEEGENKKEDPEEGGPPRRNRPRVIVDWICVNPICGVVDKNKLQTAKSFTIEFFCLDRDKKRKKKACAECQKRALDTQSKLTRKVLARDPGLLSELSLNAPEPPPNVATIPGSNEQSEEDSDSDSEFEVEIDAGGNEEDAVRRTLERALKDIGANFQIDSALNQLRGRGDVLDENIDEIDGAFEDVESKIAEMKENLYEHFCQETQSLPPLDIPADKPAKPLPALISLSKPTVPPATEKKGNPVPNELPQVDLVQPLKPVASTGDKPPVIVDFWHMQARDPVPSTSNTSVLVPDFRHLQPLDPAAIMQSPSISDRRPSANFAPASDTRPAPARVAPGSSLPATTASSWTSKRSLSHAPSFSSPSIVTSVTKKSPLNVSIASSSSNELGQVPNNLRDLQPFNVTPHDTILREYIPMPSPNLFPPSVTEETGSGSSTTKKVPSTVTSSSVAFAPKKALAKASSSTSASSSATSITAAAAKCANFPPSSSADAPVKGMASFIGPKGTYASPKLPAVGTLERPRLFKNQPTWAMGETMLSPWEPGTPVDLPDSDVSPEDSIYKLGFHGEVVNGEQQYTYRLLSTHQLAYSDPAVVRLPVGTRVIAPVLKYRAAGAKYYAGIVGEPPKESNHYRYLVFFDDGCATYFWHSHLRVVVYQSEDVCQEVHESNRKFMSNYLREYPDVKMVRLTPGQTLKTEWTGKWWDTQVVQIDASLAKLYFKACKRTEWIYRGNPRLQPLFVISRESKARREKSGKSYGCRRNMSLKRNDPVIEYAKKEDIERERQGIVEEGPLERVANEESEKDVGEMVKGVPKKDAFKEVSIEDIIKAKRGTEDEVAAKVVRNKTQKLLRVETGAEKVGAELVKQESAEESAKKIAEEIAEMIAEEENEIEKQEIEVESVEKIEAEPEEEIEAESNEEIETEPEEEIEVESEEEIEVESEEEVEFEPEDDFTVDIETVDELEYEPVEYGVDIMPVEEDVIEPVPVKRVVARKKTGGAKKPVSKTIDTWDYKGETKAVDVPVQDPMQYVPHACRSDYCLGPDQEYNFSEKDLPRLQFPTALMIPIVLGWKREITSHTHRGTVRKVFYTAPCGRRLRNLFETQRYLVMVNSALEIDFFCFDFRLNVRQEFQVERNLLNIPDLSYGKEIVPLSCVNSISKEYPDYVEYCRDRLPQKNVNLNLDQDFLVCCDCTDDCQNRAKCACRKLTIQSTAASPDAQINTSAGYVYRRLKDVIPTGIYECNSRCRCQKSCHNRVAQNPTRIKLQIFKTLKRGWGTRTLYDIPCGAFICIYVGYLYGTEESNIQGKHYGDEYFAELDMIETVERNKEGYESDVEDIECDEEIEEETETNATASLNYLDPKDKPVVLKGIVPSHDAKDRQTRSKGKAEGAAEKIAKNPKLTSTRKFYGKDEEVYIMDAKSIGNLGRYLNHSCSPNVFVQNCFVDTHDLRFPWVAFFALKHIPAGSELCWDYCYVVDQVEGKEIYCECGSKNCRGRLL